MVHPVPNGATQNIPWVSRFSAKATSILGNLSSVGFLHRTAGQPIQLIGVEFSRKGRHVVRFAVEKIDDG